MREMFPLICINAEMLTFWGFLFHYDGQCLPCPSDWTLPFTNFQGSHLWLCWLYNPQVFAGCQKMRECMVGVLLVVWPPLGRIRYSSGPGHLYWSTNAGCNMRCLVRTRVRLTGFCLSLVEWFGIWSIGMALSHYVMLCCSFCTVTQILPDKSTYSP